MTPRLENLVSAAAALIAAGLKEFRRPAVSWSSGKDSMVLLHLCREHGAADLPVIFHREPHLPARYAFADQVIRDWNLSVHDWPPAASVLFRNHGHLSVIHRFNMGGDKTCDMPVDLFEPESGPFVCGLHDVLLRPKATLNHPWDALFIGAKSSDVDPLLGAMPLKASLVRNVGTAALMFPLRDWTDADIWEYIEAHGVPYQTDRYEKRADGRFAERADKTGNPDYLPGCTRCLDPAQPPTVFCPKVNAEVNNLSAQLPWLKALRPAYVEEI